MTITLPIIPAPVSPLRHRLIDDMGMRLFSSETQRNYIRDIGRLATFLGRPPDMATAENRIDIDIVEGSDPAARLEIRAYG